MDNDDGQVLGQLGGFALGEVFKDLGIDTGDGISSVQGQLGLSSTSAFSRDTIYGGKFVDAGGDDDDDDDDIGSDDLEAEVDREMYDEKWEKQGSKAVAASTGGGQQQKLMRGEEDDFDEYDDEDEPSAPAAPAQGDATMTAVKEEPRDDLDTLFGFGNGQTEQSQQTQDVRMSIEPIAPAAPVKQADVKELFPSFDYGKTLDFTELFSSSYRPRKRQKTEFVGAKGE